MKCCFFCSTSFFMIVVYHKALLIATLSVLVSHENFKSDHPVKLYIKVEACLKHCKSDAVVQKPFLIAYMTKPLTKIGNKSSINSKYGGILQGKPKYCGCREKGRSLCKTKVTVVSIGCTGKGDVLVQRKIERIKTLKVTMLSMKKSREYIRFCRQ